jgi:hypothetical protein
LQNVYLRLGKNSNGCDANPPGGFYDPTGNFTTIGYQYPFNDTFSTGGTNLWTLQFWEFVDRRPGGFLRLAVHIVDLCKCWKKERLKGVAIVMSQQK